MRKPEHKKHFLDAKCLLDGIGNSGHVRDMLNVMVRDTVKKSTDMALVKESLETGFRVGPDFREQDPDFIDVADAVSRYEPRKQIAWMLGADVPRKEIWTLLRDAAANIRRAERFLEASDKEIPELYDEFNTSDLHDQFESFVENTIYEALAEKASRYCTRRSINWDIVFDLAKERAKMVNERGPVEQVAYLFSNGYSEQDLYSGFEPTIAGQNDHPSASEETPEP